MKTGVKARPEKTKIIPSLPSRNTSPVVGLDLVTSILYITITSYGMSEESNLNGINTPFRLSEYENWDKIEDRTAIFILDQAEKNLSDLIITADLLTQRAVTALQYSISFIIGIIGFMYTPYATGVILHLSIIGIITLIPIVIYSFKVYSSYRVKPVGNTPINLITEEKVLSDKQYLVFVYNAIKNVQKSIEFTVASNDLRVKAIWKIELIIKAGIIIVVTYPLLYLLVSHP